MQWRVALADGLRCGPYAGAVSLRVEPVLILASGSPRRRELLDRFGLAFDVRSADVDESVRGAEPPEDLVRRLALAKAEAVLAAASEPDVVVLAADTVVVLDHEVLGQPVDAADAAHMLRRLSGRTHVALTGVAVVRRAAAPNGGPRTEVVLAPAVRVEVEVVATEVTFVELNEADIGWYVATGEPLDKAGAYAVQGSGGIFVSSIRGSHDNVVGLPLAVTRRLLAGAGVEPCSDPAA